MKKEKPNTPPNQPPKSPKRRFYERVKVISMLVIITLLSYQSGAGVLPLWVGVVIVVCATIIGAEYEPDEDDDDDDDGDEQAVPVAN